MLRAHVHQIDRFSFQVDAASYGYLRKQRWRINSTLVYFLH
jgi:hypothetical protein